MGGNDPKHVGEGEGQQMVWKHVTQKQEGLVRDQKGGDGSGQGKRGKGHMYMRNVPMKSITLCAS